MGIEKVSAPTRTRVSPPSGPLGPMLWFRPFQGNSCGFDCFSRVLNTISLIFGYVRELEESFILFFLDFLLGPLTAEIWSLLTSPCLKKRAAGVWGPDRCRSKELRKTFKKFLDNSSEQSQVRWQIDFEVAVVMHKSQKSVDLVVFFRFSAFCAYTVCLIRHLRIIPSVSEYASILNKKNSPKSIKKYTFIAENRS